jgi:hypothetical protein
MELQADCSRCVGLCCVAPAFARSADFAIDKPADTPCPNLQADSRCGIHSTLRDRGFGGCTAYDCFGAGQRATAGATVRTQEMLDLFRELRPRHELLWHLDAAAQLPTSAGLRGALRSAGDGTWEAANALLLKASELAREPLGADLRGADLVGKDLRTADLTRASLRGALLIGADLRDVDLALTDVTGADLRGADLRGADLSRTLFLTPMQRASARR